MSIKLVDETTWSGILKVQSEVYLQVEPESIDVLKSKWYQSPDCCFVCQEDNNVLGYLLAHSWNKEVPPKLFQPLPEQSDMSGSILFLHDLAISNQVAGKGVGAKMVSYLLNVAIRLKFEQIRLVAVQGSSLFWEKMGFTEIKNQSVSPTYGDGAKIMKYIL
ncbi:GNAT family N-acetyltransferase [Vibrio ziniensis]|uniref:GNAT family N-acetyltransferase n=1 Tax=Vibrio ziniensis TaxID=2711221 RepID=A0A6G7CHZ3_9VIBR|nr:GNAT family N-acetyltransferase [Vibrio ziniensis]QIH41658.1 GNAT family N-acetyltransferase [Vibrio ziniensis]